MLIKNIKDITKEVIKRNKPIFIKYKGDIVGIVYRHSDIGKWVAVSTWSNLVNIVPCESLKTFIKLCHEKEHELHIEE